MKKGWLLLGLCLGLSALSIGATTTVSASTDLLTNRNYYKLDSIHKGFLDEPISESVLGNGIWAKFQVAVQKKLITYTPGMTFNQYYLANNISPEDNFTVYPNLTDQYIPLPSGAYLNANPNPQGVKDLTGNVVDYLTYVGPTDDRGAYWGDTELADPILFSRLTVGHLPNADNPMLMKFPDGTYQFPTQIGYGESATANDYMLTPQNDFVLPARYNKVRDDVYLTMRSRAYFGAGLQGAQAFLSASTDNGPVVGSADNAKRYIDTSTNVFLTQQGYAQLGTLSKLMANTVYTRASASLQKVGIDQFAAKMNAGMKTIQANSRVDDIVSGNGGQIQLTGFDRVSQIDNAYRSDNAARQADATHTIAVTYYMYTSGNTHQTVVTPLAPNGNHLYSPNVSVFKIQTSRPYLTAANANDAPIAEKTALADFDHVLGADSITITDNGRTPDGQPVGVVPANLKVRLSLDGGHTYTDTAYSLSELKAALQAHTFDAQTLTLAYTYAAADANAVNIGQLPDEIADNTGAYAVPYVRTVALAPRVKGTVVVKYVDETGKSIATDTVLSGNVGDSYTATQKVIAGYTLKNVQGNETGTLTEKAQTVTYVYTKTPVVGGHVIVQYLDENGTPLSATITLSGYVGAPYTTIKKVIPGFTLKTIKGNPTGILTDKSQTVTYVYAKVMTPTTGHHTTPATPRPQTHTRPNPHRAHNLPQAGDHLVGARLTTLIGAVLLVLSAIGAERTWHKRRQH
ncbi:MucBP domain-containing protein [Lacticaseibacillus absianus]|uniref:MucBP domain-containing protein n=1 Tax=Lacticaseibacillus absianus TaxID=2729623 RepID=UPI0015C72048|nr:MucBP domain-containing protein [Lacticaseibacillus absianus]